MPATSPSSIPPEPNPLPFDALGHLRTDAVRFFDLVTDHGLDRAVPSCPGWTMGDLAWHLGKVWNRWGRIVADGLTTQDAVQRLGHPERPSDELLIDWVTAAHTMVYSALAEAGDHVRVWNWSGVDQPTSWVRRRMTHETAVHRWDAANAVGVPYEIPVAVAADGIDEFLMWFAARRPTEAAAEVGGSVHLHCTDTDDDLNEGSDDRSNVNGEWLVSRLDTAGIEFTREHAKGDAAVRGGANDLLLWLWRRDAGPVEILGDADVAGRFRAFPSL